MRIIRIKMNIDYKKQKYKKERRKGKGKGKEGWRKNFIARKTTLFYMDGIV